MAVSHARYHRQHAVEREVNVLDRLVGLVDLLSQYERRDDAVSYDVGRNPLLEAVENRVLLHELRRHGDGNFFTGLFSL